MSDEVAEKVEIVRDRALEQKLLEAVIADRNESPRNQQVAVGPSSIGFCRELLRAQLFEGTNNAAGMADVITEETHWATAAHVGTVMGEALEKIFGQRLAQVITQERVTTYFPMVGVSISGALDLAFIDEEYVTDLKSTTDIGGLLYDLNKNAELIATLLNIWRQGKLFEFSVETPDGGYELTQVLLRKFSKLQYWTQVATYVVGCVQAGLLPDTAEGRLVFYDRAGEFQEFLAAVISNEEIAMFFEIGQHRVLQVAQAQTLFEQSGNLHLIHQLRDQTPSFCFSPKVMCPLRERCWGGSEWEPEEVLDSPDVSSSIDRYIEGRRLKKIGEGMTNGARAELKGIEGSTPDGRKVSWPGGRINVVETSRGAKAREDMPKSAVDVAQEAMARVALVEQVEAEREALLGPEITGPHIHRTKPGTKACAEGRCNPKTIVSHLPDSPGESVPDLMGNLRESIEHATLKSVQIDEDGMGWIAPDEEPPPPDWQSEAEEAAQGGEVGYPEQGLERDPRVERVQFVDTDPRPPEHTPAEVVLATTPGLTPTQREYLERAAVRERGKPLGGAELKAALEADTSAGRLRKQQAQVEATGQIGRSRAAAQAKRDSDQSPR